LHLVRLAGGAARELTRSSMPEVVSGPAWAIDGRHLFFVKSQLGIRSELWRIDTVTGQMNNTGVAAEDLRCIRVHPDGRHLAFSAVGSQPELWAISGFMNELARRMRDPYLRAQK
jgi:Tol biopolymer transport system component